MVTLTFTARIVFAIATEQHGPPPISGRDYAKYSSDILYCPPCNGVYLRITKHNCSLLSLVYFDSNKYPNAGLTSKNVLVNGLGALSDISSYFTVTLIRLGEIWI